MQIHDFILVYESKSDEELLLVARDIDQLTPEARAALLSEFSRRGLKETSIAEVVGDRSAEVRPIVRAVSKRLTSTNEFLWDVTRTYRDHFWLFIKLIAPATLLAYCLVHFGRDEVRNRVLFAAGEGALSRNTAVFVMTLVAQVTYFLTWMLFCVAYAWISSAIVRLESGGRPSMRECLTELLTRKWNFFKVSALLFVFLGVGIILRNAFAGGLFLLFPHQMLSRAGRTFDIALGYLVILAVSRLSLAIPIVLYDGCTVRESIFRSDKLTNGKWAALAALVVKAVLGGYIAGMLPFWVADWTWPHLYLNVWILMAASAIAVGLVEPFMLIGFSLMYVNSREGARGAPKAQDVALQST